MDQIIASQSAFDLAPARLTIDIKAIVANWQALRALSGTAETGAVLKADAYGLGALPIAAALYRAGCRTVFVATAEEGVALRPALPDARIFVLSGFWPGLECLFAEADLIPTLSSDAQLADFRAAFPDRPFALNFDTGMNRLGFGAADAGALAALSAKPDMVMSHLACSDIRGNAMNARQLADFRAIAAQFAGVEASLASSGGIALGRDYLFDLTRPGIALYGGAALSGEANAMQPVLRAEARILQVRKANKGEGVSYGGTQVLTRDSRLAIAGAGYADGWHRAMSGSDARAADGGRKGGFGEVHGHRVPIVGRVTMDLTIFDVTDVPEALVRPGDYVTLIGDGISLEMAAQAAGTISYELLTSLGRRYERRYI